MNHGKFNVLPWLGKVTSLVGLQDISDVEVDKATTDYEWKDHALHLSNLDVRKNDVTRIAGECGYRCHGQVDGRLKLGLPSSVTAKWPQLQDKVFPVQLDDFNWADVHVTGTSGPPSGRPYLAPAGRRAWDREPISSTKPRKKRPTFSIALWDTPAPQTPAHP